MNVFDDIIHNKLLFAVLFAWLLAQIIKTVLNLVMKKSFDAERLYGSGGMPSSHTAGVTTLSICSGIIYGFSGFEFAVSTLIAILVIYDARGVRREAGKHAKILNEIIDAFQDMEFKDKVKRDERLNELIGHNGLQIFAGMLLGILFSLTLYWTGFITKI